ncbi:MAG TPA: hypothetical protein VFC07_13125 [Verrucomicrobiae bacterium]|nr:hypothetical protein [Verrucomicrobiae bacterium]
MSAKAIPIAKFRIGRIVSTPQALKVLSHEDILAGITRHQAGDWGEVSQADREANDRALIHGTRLLSVYRSGKGVKFRIVTEGDRSATTVLLPEDY